MPKGETENTKNSVDRAKGASFVNFKDKAPPPEIQSISLNKLHSQVYCHPTVSELRVLSSFLIPETDPLAHFSVLFEY